MDSGGEVEPESPVLGGMWKGDQGSRDRHVTGSDTPPQVWMAPQDWASQGTKPTASDQQGPEERREEREPGVERDRMVWVYWMMRRKRDIERMEKERREVM